MVIFKKAKDLQNYIHIQKAAGLAPGFVPTMGALHAGHRSLIERAKSTDPFIVCSIFVNPTQFNDKNDLARYPITTEADIELLTLAGCDVLFLPSEDEVYPGGEKAAQVYDFGYLETVLDGARRPGHFKGVGQVVARLLSIVQPSKLYLGQKDYQQCLVLKKLVSILGLQDTEVIVCPTIREADGLAMSSRNRRLTEPQRAISGAIYQCLISIESKQHTAPFSIVKKECEDLLQAKGFVTDYVELADANSLQLLTDYQTGEPMVALIAAKLGDVRLIDNIVLSRQ